MFQSTQNTWNFSGLPGEARTVHTSCSGWQCCSSLMVSFCPNNSGHYSLCLPPTSHTQIPTPQGEQTQSIAFHCIQTRAQEATWNTPFRSEILGMAQIGNLPVHSAPSSLARLGHPVPSMGPQRAISTPGAPYDPPGKKTPHCPRGF